MMKKILFFLALLLGLAAAASWMFFERRYFIVLAGGSGLFLIFWILTLVFGRGGAAVDERPTLGTVPQLSVVNVEGVVYMILPGNHPEGKTLCIRQNDRAQVQIMNTARAEILGSRDQIYFAFMDRAAQQIATNAQVRR
jgi:hypothetical protein